MTDYYLVRKNSVSNNAVWEVETNLTIASIPAIEDLANVNITLPLNNQVLSWSTSENSWKNQTLVIDASSINLDDLGDVSIFETIQPGDVLTYAANGSWVSETPVVADDINDLLDVDIGNPNSLQGTGTPLANNDILVYSQFDSAWVNVPRGATPQYSNVFVTYNDLTSNVFSEGQITYWREDNENQRMGITGSNSFVFALIPGNFTLSGYSTPSNFWQLTETESTLTISENSNNATINLLSSTNSSGNGFITINYNLTTTGDSGLKIYSSNSSSTNTAIHAFLSNKDSYVVASNNSPLGNFGVGTQNPEYRLDVYGDVKIANAIVASNSKGTAGQVLTSNGPTGNVYWSSVIKPELAESVPPPVETQLAIWTTGYDLQGNVNLTFLVDGSPPTLVVNGSISIANTFIANGTSGEAGQVLTSGGIGQVPYWAGSSSFLLGDLTDVDLTSLQDGQSIFYNGVTWLPGDVIQVANDINNIVITSPVNGEILVYDNGDWVNQAFNAGNLEDLTNVTITSPQNNQVLRYVGGVWINDPASGGNVSNWNTPLDNQIAVWRDATTIEGDSNFTWNGSTFTVTGTTISNYVTINNDLTLSSKLNAASSFGTSGQVLTSAGSGSPVYWADSQSPLTAGDGINITNDIIDAVAGNTTIFVDASGIHVNTAALPFSAQLNGLSDVSISGAQTNQVLKYNGSIWTNAADATGGGGGLSADDHLIPTSNAVYSLGNTSFNWANVHFSGLLEANGFFGTAGQVLTSAGPGANAYWSTVTASGGGSGAGGAWEYVETIDLGTAMTHTFNLEPGVEAYKFITIDFETPTSGSTYNHLIAHCDSDTTAGYYAAARVYTSTTGTRSAINMNSSSRGLSIGGFGNANDGRHSSSECIFYNSSNRFVRTLVHALDVAQSAGTLTESRIFSAYSNNGATGPVSTLTFTTQYDNQTSISIHQPEGTLHIYKLNTSAGSGGSGGSGGGASSLTQTFSTTSQSTLDTFALATYGSAEYLIQATRGSDRQLTKLLIVHDSTTAFSTEYGTIITNAELFTTSVAINGSDVEIYVTGTSATSTTYNALYNLVDA